MNFPTLVALPHMQLFGNATVYGSIVPYQCDSGFRFSDRKHSKNVSCLGQGQWTAELEPCDSEGQLHHS